MDKESNMSSAVQSLDHRQHRRPRKEPPEPHTASSLSSSSTTLILPDPYESQQSLKGNRSGMSLQPNQSSKNGLAAGKGADGSRSHGSGSTPRIRDSRDDFMRREKSVFDHRAKTSKSNNDSYAQSRVKGKNSAEAQRKGFRGPRPAPNSAGRPKPAPADANPFDMKMNDFPELAGVSLGKSGPSVGRKECWGAASNAPTPASSWRSGRRETSTQPEPTRIDSNAKPDSSVASPGQPVVTSWANVASQPPKKPLPKEETISNNHTEEVETQQEDGAPGKKKRRKKKKKAKGGAEEAGEELEETAIYQEPPKFEDEEEFPGLTPTLTGTDRLLKNSYAAKLCNEEIQREGVQQHQSDQNKEISTAGKTQPTEMAKKAQKPEKAPGKKSKVPVQLDIGNMLAALEKKQQSQKAKQDAKPLILSVGGGLPVVQKQPLVQKKLPWLQDKIAHNPLDSTSPLVKKGKQREVPKAKKPTPLKKVILKEREERKLKRLQEERADPPQEELRPAHDAAAAEEEEEEQQQQQWDANVPDEVGSATEELEDQSQFNSTNQMVKEADEEADREEAVEQQTNPPVTCPVQRPKIHSRKFRDYCSQMLSKDVDECVTALLKELVRFQDRLYQKDPMKARMKRRLVMGLREVLKHLKLRKVKCVVISPNCERIQSKGGLDEALYTIIDTCREQGVPFVFALSRKVLGRCVNKAVPVSLVGIFNYDGAQDLYHKMIELSSEARRAYEEMVLLSLEQSSPADEEQAGSTEEELKMGSLNEQADTTQPEEPEYIKTWKKMLEKDCNHKFLNFEEQLRSMHLDSECTENTNEEEDS